MTAVDLDRRTRRRRASFASHRLVGWIDWEPRFVDGYAALGIPNGAGYSMTKRAGRLGGACAGADVVVNEAGIDP